MTNQDILRIAMEQSATESGCGPQDFLKRQNRGVLSRQNPGARKYLELPFSCDLTSYGNCIVASVAEELFAVVSAYINQYPVEHCFETPSLLVLQEKIRPFGLDVCFMAEYFLPDLDILVPLSCAYPHKILYPKDFSDLYLPQWGNVLSKDHKERDVLAVAAFDGDRIVGMAGASADCDTMWQIGVDVLPEYRQRGIASALTSILATEVLKMGKAPFYCCAWSNIRSVRNAIKSGFRPAWVQLTTKKIATIQRMNQ